MVFCGQCGFQLAPGTTQCPRCGTKVEEPVMEPGDLTAPDAPTIASQSVLGRSPVQPTPQPLTGETTQGGSQTSNNDPQKLVLPPVSNQNTYGIENESTRTAYARPSRVNTPGYNTQNPTTGTPYPQSGGDYPTRNAYPDYGTQAGYQGYNTQVRGNYQEPVASSSSRGRVVGLVLILLGLLFILGAVILFMLQRNHVISDNNSGSSAAISAPTTGGGNPANVTTGTNNGGANQGSTTGGAGVNKAQAVVQQYYTAINRKEYRVAYNLRQNNPQSFAEFSNGFRNTLNDKLTFGTATVQQDGAVQVAVTIDATERANGKLQHKVYTGYYTVGQQPDGVWKILDGVLQ